MAARKKITFMNGGEHIRQWVSSTSTLQNISNNDVIREARRMFPNFEKCLYPNRWAELIPNEHPYSYDSVRVLCYQQVPPDFDMVTLEDRASPSAKKPDFEVPQSPFYNCVSEEDIHAHFSSVLQLINSNNLNVTLESANRVYVQNKFKLLETYIEGIKKHYGGELEEINFGQASEAANKINAFVEKATHDKIKSLVSADAFNDLTRLVLVNAIYFKGEWDTQFKEENTRDADFYSSPDNTKKVKMMSLESKFPYYENDDYQVLGLPYKNQQVSMYIILPRERFGLQKLVQNMNASTLAQLLAKKGRTEVKVQLPRFKIESSFELGETLKKLGIVDAFGSSANFSGITDNGDLQVSDVIHKAFSETNEQGSEAAAASAAVMMTRMRPAAPKPTPTFIADHSFLYVIVNADQNILFIGNYLD